MQYIYIEGEDKTTETDKRMSIFGYLERINIKNAFEAFMKNDFKSAVDSATKASWGGNGYFVELFDTGAYRVPSDGSIGNLYYSPGLVLGVPALTDEEWDEDSSVRYYDGAEELMREKFQEEWDANSHLQAAIAFPE
jgi:hypothetical protein